MFTGEDMYNLRDTWVCQIQSTINTFIRSAKVAYLSILNLAYLTLLEVSVALK